VAARLRRELGIEAEMRKGPYGRFEVLVDGETVVDGGKLALLGVLPSARDIVATLRTRLARGSSAS
jgi:hypothetical protein